jgi:hypothetical protein
VSRRPLLPNLRVIGAATSGTTSLVQYLRAHPQAYMPGFEPHHFTAERRWKLGQAWYESEFAAAGNAVAVGEKSARYSRYRGVPYRSVATKVDQTGIVFSDQVRTELEAKLGDDVGRLRGHLDPEFDGWGIG